MGPSWQFRGQTKRRNAVKDGPAKWPSNKQYIEIEKKRERTRK